MKITESRFGLGRGEAMDPAVAVKRAITIAGNDRGQIERIDEEVERLTIIVAVMAKVLVDHKLLTVEAVDEMLGYGFRVEES